MSFDKIPFTSCLFMSTWKRGPGHITSTNVLRKNMHRILYLMMKMMKIMMMLLIMMMIMMMMMMMKILMMVRTIRIIMMVVMMHCNDEGEDGAIYIVACPVPK